MPKFDVEALKAASRRAIDEVTHELYTLTLDIHGFKELAFQEHKSSEAMKTFLTANGFIVEKPFGGLDTAFRSIVGNTLGKSERPLTVAICCEYDALPEIGHACGHNLIAEVGAGAAIGIQAAIEEAAKTGLNLGKLHLIGTPAEEETGGKIYLIRAEAFKSVDFAMMCHPNNFTVVDPGAQIICIQFVDVTYIGESSHAAAFPWEGINALDAALLAMNNISAYRQQMKPNWRVHGIITEGGNKPNIIPDRTKMSFIIRAPIKSELETLRANIHRCYSAAAEATGCEVVIEWNPDIYLNLLTNNTLAERFTVNANVEGIDTSPDPRAAYLVGSTDFGNLSYEVPGVHPFFTIGVDTPSHTAQFAADAKHISAQAHVIQNAKAMASTAIDIFCDDALALQMKKDFDEDIANARGEKTKMKKDTKLAAHICGQ